MRLRQEYEKWESEFLAPAAMKSADSIGREFPEEEHPFRTSFQRDRDRVIHSNAFRRLEYKTQVFVYHEGDHYRTRLTHSIEGAQIARTIARALRLNEDLAEAIILAHDLGHTPFGHSGEAALNRLMADHGGYEHNRQSLRIVTLLEERYPGFPGLNLTYEVREGLAKHQTIYDQTNLQASLKKMGRPTLEAQIVNRADEIAYLNHDLDDGLRSGLITLGELEGVPLWREHCRFPADWEPKIRIRQTIRAIINSFVTRLVVETEERLNRGNVTTVLQVRESPVDLVGYPDGFEKESGELKEFLGQYMYRHYRVERMADKAERILDNLFRTYLKNPKILPPDVYEKVRRGEPERTVCDYIAGMTDRFALDEYRKLFDPLEKV